MGNLIRLVGGFCLLLLTVSCNKKVEPTVAPPPGGGGNEISTTINLSKTYQTIESFSASDCWAPNYVGKYWTESEKADIAKLLFSSNINNGQPEGIGLSGWRFNLGGGTANQGAASDITDVTRRAESFMDPVTGQLDWTKAAGQQYFLEKAKNYGCQQFVLFSNTPPVYLTRNGKGYSGSGAYANLKDGASVDFANYIANVLSYFKTTKNIEFSLISPVNEPQYDWKDPTQEGSGWQNSEIKTLTAAIDNALEAKGLNTKILLAEAGNWTYLYSGEGDNNRRNVINSLFNQASGNYVGNLKHVAKIVAGHSYWTDNSWSNLTTSRQNVANAASAAGLGVYQTEWSMLGDNYDKNDFVGFDKATEMDIALYMSKVIHSDLVYANAASWSFWTSMDMERWGHKNRFLLIKITPAGGVYGDITQSGSHEAAKTLWALGNYSLFVRPGYKRVDMTIDGMANKLLGSAYLSADNKKLVCIYSNLTDKDYAIKSNLDVSNIQSANSYITNSVNNLKLESLDFKSPINIKAKSVTTVVYSLK